MSAAGKDPDDELAGTEQPFVSHLVELRGKRLAYTSETADGDQMSAAQVKLIIGGDPITARDLYEKPVTFLPSHTLFVATNRRPHARQRNCWVPDRSRPFRTTWAAEQRGQGGT